MVTTQTAGASIEAMERAVTSRMAEAVGLAVLCQDKIRECFAKPQAIDPEQYREWLEMTLEHIQTVRVCAVEISQSIHL